MDVRRRSRIWTQQPHVAAMPASRKSPKFIISAGEGVVRDVVNNRVGAASGNANVGVFAGLRAAKFDGSGDYYSLASHQNYNITGALTLVWVGTVEDRANYYMLATRASGNGATANPFELRIDPGTGTILLTRAHGAYQYSSFSSSSAVPTGKQVVVVATHGGDLASTNGLSFWIDGVFAGINTVVLEGASGPAVGNNEPFLLGARQDGYSHKGSTALLAGFDRILTNAEIADVSANPWQIFAPQTRRRLISAGAGGSSLSPTLHSNTQTFYSPTVFTGAVTLAPTLFSNAQTFYALVVSSTKTLAPTLHSNAQVFYGPTANASKSLVASLFTNAATHFTHTVSQAGAPQALTSTLYSNAQTFFTPAVGSTRALAPTLHSNAQVFYGSTVHASKSLVGSLFTNSATHFTHTVSQAEGPQAITPTLFSNGQTFFTPAVGVGAVTLSPALFSNAQTYYSHVLNQAGGPQNVAPPLLTNSATFYSHSLAPGSVAVAPSLFSNSNAFYSLTLTTSKTLTPALHTNMQAFYSPIVTIAGGPLVIEPTLFSNTASFFTHTVATGVAQLYPLRLDNESAFYPATVGNGPVFTGSISDEDIARIAAAVLQAIASLQPATVSVVVTNLDQINALTPQQFIALK